MGDFKKRALAAMLVMGMVCTSMPMTVMAEEEHKHDYVVSDYDESIYAECHNYDGNCGCEFITIEACESKDGSEIEIREKETWIEEGLSIDSIYYEGVGDTVYQKSDVAPIATTKKEKYKVTINAEGKSVVKEVEIVKHEKVNIRTVGYEIIAECADAGCADYAWATLEENGYSVEIKLKGCYEALGLKPYIIEGYKDGEYYQEKNKDYKITYEGVGDTDYKKCEVFPEDMKGTFKVSVTIGEQTAELIYEKIYTRQEYENIEINYPPTSGSEHFGETIDSNYNGDVGCDWPEIFDDCQQRRQLVDELDKSYNKYLFINVSLQENNTRTSEPVKFIMQLPNADEMIDSDITNETAFYVVRNHECKVEILDSKVIKDEEGNRYLIFETDKFYGYTEYALVYTNNKKCDVIEDMVYVPSKSVTCLENGSIGHFKSVVSGEKYKDVEGKKKVTDNEVIIKCVGKHDWKFDNEYGIEASCRVCYDYVSLGAYSSITKIEVYSDAWLEKGLTISEIWYEGIGSTKYEKSNVKPIETGAYKVTIVAEGMTYEYNVYIESICANKEHNWNVEWEEECSKLKFTCKNDDCSYGFEYEWIELSLNDGIIVDIHGDKGDCEILKRFFEDLGIEDYSILHEGVYPTVYEKSSKEPVDIGTYKVIITIEGKKFEIQYKIKTPKKDAVQKCECSKLEATKEKEATCTEEGIKGYYKCTECNKKYSDAEGKTEVTDEELVVSAKGHKLTEVKEKEATCTEEGIKAHYNCENCNKKYSDDKGKTEVNDKELVVEAKGHKLTKVEGKEPTCVEEGMKEYYSCSECNKKYSDAEGKTEVSDSDLVVPTKEHKTVTIPGYAPTCYEDGLTDGIKCSECGIMLQDQLKIVCRGHNMKYIPTIASTYSQEGKLAYWLCSGCGEMYADSQGIIKTCDELLRIDKLKLGVTKSIKASVRKSSAITFTWDKVPGATGYRVYIAKNGKWVQLKQATYANSYTATKLAAGTSYVFAVKAYRIENGKVIWSNAYKSVALKTLIGRTAKITKKAEGKTKVNLTWSKVKGATGYRLYYKQNGKWVTLQSATKKNTIRISNLKPGTSYTFAVKAYAIENGKVVWSDCYTQVAVKMAK